ncbi:hypothetical protein BU15DRAFT_78376 [Melanogaster broomeanus]|nr:hypothetical protein BU15DRAFT_78376 [Melanogaster broomeanus]
MQYPKHPRAENKSSQEADEITGETETEHLSDQGDPDRSRSPPKPSLAETPCPISSLPFELLHLILEYATPPNLFLNPSVGRGPSSAWCLALRQLKYFVLVSRWWREVSSDLLYCHVVIRRIVQLTALLRSLEANPKLGPFVRSLRITCFPPRGHGFDFEDQLNRVCALCTQNTHLILNHRSVPHYHDFPTIDGSILSSIVDLEIGWGSRFPPVISLLVHCKNVARLTINFQGAGRLDDIPAIQFPSLEELHCTCSPAGSELAVISRQWSLPRLRRFSISHQEPYILYKGYYSFLHEHGKKLTYLDISIWPFPNSLAFLDRGYRTIQQFLDLCSSLKHLVIIDCHDLGRLSHPTLEYLDIWRDFSGKELEDMTEIRLPSFSEKRLPSLRKTRLLHASLRDPFGDSTRLPILVPPDFVGDKDVEWSYPGLRILHSPTLMRP